MRRLRFQGFLFLTLLAVALVSLLVFGLLSIRLYQQLIDQISTATAEQSLRRVVDRVDERVLEAIELEQLYQRLTPRGELTSAEFPQLFQQLWPAFEASTKISFWGVGILKTGEFAVLGSTPEGITRLQMYVRDAQTGDQIRIYEPSRGGLRLVEQLPWTNAGPPRETYILGDRHFVRHALQTGCSSWTDSYEFWSGEVPSQLRGVSYSTPLKNAAGETTLVWNIDLEVSSLTEFLSTIQQEVTRRLFIAEHRADGQWKLIAAPAASFNGDDSPLSSDLLTTELLSRLSQHAPPPTSAAAHLENIDIGGRHYRLITSRLVGPGRPDWVVAELWPAKEDRISDLLAGTSILYSLMVASLIAAVASYHLSRYVAFPLEVLEQEARWLVKGERTEMPLVGGPSEIRRLSKTLNQLAVTVRQRQQEIEEAHHELRISHERLQVHVNETPVGMLELNNEGLIVSWNRAAERIFGWSSEEAVGRHYSLIIPTEIRPSIQQVVEAVWHHEGGNRNENQNLTKDGRIIDCEWFNTSLMSEDGETFGVASLVLDVTERKRTQAELLELNERLDARVRERTAELQRAMSDLQSFSYSVAHDLRAPLRSIDGFGQVLLDDCGPLLTTEGREHLARIRQATQRMADLIDALLRLTRVVRQEATRERVNLSEIVTQTLQLRRQSEPQRVIRWTIQPDLMVWGDRNLLRILLENLCDNAWKYSRSNADAHVEFFCEDRGDGRWFAIRDNGVGFDSAYAHKALEPFQRLHRMEEFEGHGIGLATATRIAQKHGGEVRLETVPTGGAVCWFRLGELASAETSAFAD